MSETRYVIQAIEIAGLDDPMSENVYDIGEPVSCETFETIFKTVEQVSSFLDNHARKRDDHDYFAISVNETDIVSGKVVSWDDYVPGKGLNQMGRGVVDPETWYWETGYFKEMADA